jgi:predicted branched-subunit amino acid permease
VVNLRHALYSASVAPYLKDLSLKWKGILAYLLTDEAYAAVITCLRKNEVSECRHWFFLGAGLALWTTWQISTGVGFLFGIIIPSEWPLDFAIPLTFIALLAPNLDEGASAGAALTAGIAAVVLFGLPYHSGILVAAYWHRRQACCWRETDELLVGHGPGGTAHLCHAPIVHIAVRIC